MSTFKLAILLVLIIGISMFLGYTMNEQLCAHRAQELIDNGQSIYYVQDLVYIAIGK